MKNEIIKVKLFINENVKSRRVAKKVRETLHKKGFQEVEEDYSLAIAIGGDGSFLRMIKESNFNSDILYVGINAGTLGFAQDIEISEIDSFIRCLKKGDYSYEKIGIGEASIETLDSTSRFHFLNEVVIRDEELNTVGLDVLIDNNILENYIGDGLLIATSFGSTAYNLSFGGSIVYNTFHTMQITAIAPLNNKSYRTLLNSVIIPSEKVITILPNRGEKNLMLMVDGDNKFYNNVEKITLSIPNKTIKVIRKKDYNFVQKINDKFLK